MSSNMNSVLNPEAPEFYPHLTSVTQDGYKSVTNSIRKVNTMPTGVAHDLFKTFTDFNVVTCQLRENVIYQSNKIIATELPTVRLKRNDNLYTMDKVIEVNDSLLDRINVNININGGVNKPIDAFSRRVPFRTSASSWNTAPVIAKIQMGSATFIGAKNIPRPQLNFKDTIDNSDSLWVPKISDKPNSIKPLALNILYNEKDEAVGYEHPYQVELDLYQPPTEWIELSNNDLPFPAPLEETGYTFVDTEAQLDALVDHLTTVHELAVDLEHHSYRTYQGITCLMQITTTEGGDFIIDTLAIREHIHKLNLVFTDPKKIKIFHGAECDVIWLQRDFGVYLVGMFDTHQAARVMKLPGLSLKYLLYKYCSVDADKKYQLADWRMRPLPDELIQYARMDTHYLLYIWRKMRAELLLGDKQQVLLSVFDQSRQICQSTYNKEVITETSHLSLYTRSRKTFNTQQMAALKMIFKWRDTQARALDESTTYLLPNHMLLALAEVLPREVQGVNAICSPMPPFIKQNVINIHKMILSCRELPIEPQLFKMPTSIRTMLNNSIQTHSYSMHDFSNDYCEEYSLSADPVSELFDQSNEEPLPTSAMYISMQETVSAEPKILVSDLNADAKQFIPPFDRYRKYRSLAQMEEIREFKEKEAKIAAISKGNELIKEEVLVKLQQAKTQIETEEQKNVPTNVAIEVDDSDAKKTQQRKRKITAEKAEQNGSVDTDTEHINKELNNTNVKKKDTNVKPSVYKNVDYKKFYKNTEKPSKRIQPKTNFKKYKK